MADMTAMTAEQVRELLLISVGKLRRCKGANDSEAAHIFTAIAAIEVLAACLSGMAAVVPVDHVVVPRVPTESMIVAACKEQSYAAGYRAMLAAAPEPPHV